MRSHFILFLSIAAHIILIGCQDEGSNTSIQEMNSDDAPMTTFFLADIEGTALNATSVSLSERTINGIFYLEIYAENTSTSQELRLVIPANVPVGTYPMVIKPSADGVHGIYKPDNNSDSNSFVSTSGLFNLSQKSTNPLRVAGNTVFAMVNDQGNVDEVTFCEFVLIND